MKKCCVKLKFLRGFLLFREPYQSFYMSIIVHCEWNDWVQGSCSKSCGGGIRIDTRTESVSAKHGGDKCPGPSSMDVSCNDQECPGKNT